MNAEKKFKRKTTDTRTGYTARAQPRSKSRPPKLRKNIASFVFIFSVLCFLYGLFILPVFLVVSCIYFVLGKISLRHIKEQLGFPGLQQQNKTSQSKKGKPTIWLHVSSYGEWNSARPLLLLLKKKTKMNIFLSYFNEEMPGRLNSDTLVDEHAFLPVENPIAFLWLIKKLHIRCLLLMEGPLGFFVLSSGG